MSFPLRLNDEQRLVVEENATLVRKIIAKYLGGVCANDEDICSIGFIGLCKAAATFDEAKNYCFSTYASKCIINEVFKEKRKERAKSRCGEKTAISLNMTLPTEDEDLELIDVIPDNKMDTEKAAIDKLIRESDIFREIRQLAPTITQKIYGEFTLKEIANKEHVSVQAISQKCRRERKKVTSRFGDYVENSYI